MPIAVDALELRRLAKDRLEEARVLLVSDKLHGAKYLCGYAIEHSMKYQICKHMGWSSYPPPSLKTVSKDPSWNNLDSLKTHDLEILMLFTGLQDKIFKDAALLAAWNDVKGWNSEMRYERIPTKKTEKARIKNILDSASIMMSKFGCSTV